MDCALETSLMIKMQNMNVSTVVASAQQLPQQLPQQLQETAKPIIRAEFQEPLISSSSKSPKKTPKLKTE